MGLVPDNNSPPAVKQCARRCRHGDPNTPFPLAYNRSNDIDLPGVVVESVMHPLLTQDTLTVDDYHQLLEDGILTEDDRVELWGGKIVNMSPIGGPHLYSVNILTELMVESVRRRSTVSIQNPIR